MKKLAASAIVGTLFLSGAVQAQVDQRNTVGGLSSASTQRIGQSFIPTQGSLNFATAFLGVGSGIGANVAAEVRAGAGVGGTLLATSGTVAVRNMAGQTYTFSFTAPISVVPGSTYTLRFIAVEPLVGTFTYGIGSGDPYTRGTAFDSAGNALATSDLIFSEGIAAAPEPGAWALMILAVGVIGGALRRRRRDRSGRSVAV